MTDGGGSVSDSAVPDRFEMGPRRPSSVAAALESLTRGDDGVAAGRRGVDVRPMGRVTIEEHPWS